ncbi:EamA/RhaT family transporter [Roseobacter denitrificans]|uniref:Integral membrane protein, putative n=1 Tax=Roseobacter denitrificans (strain ATCC 33942 / OCh 114) TaxID=375451 RepID=Q168H0_ROSDO|nr:DMT family transporter [Roseobacter denitrificans]ABG31623.1 integral membrane protein, putative [Roseobacter denitrificans OCh 114]AVL54606.1 EamA/RhaT family transporter [Roseobacter denitrificans]SFF89168.1 EamA domain-containing membrane protein RarD [Roseobacter denitrificans OCh 114]
MSMTKTSQPLTGIFWMLVTGICFISVTALVKFMGTGLPPAQMAFLRYLLGLVFLIPAIGALRAAHLTPRQWKLFGFRGVIHGLGVISWFYAMTRIPLADVTAMNYLAPIYVTIGAAVFLGEKLAFRRIAAVVMALIGAFIILRPGFRDISSGHFAMLFTALAFGASYLTAKVTADEVKPSVVVAMLSIFVTIVLAPFALINWVTPTLWELFLLFCIACCAVAGHYTMTLAFAAAPVTVTQPVTFTQLIWAVLLGYFAFGEAVDIWVVIGGVVILSSVTFITWREAVLKRKPTTPTLNETKG